MRVKMSKQPPPAPTASAVGPCPTIIKIVGRPGTGSVPSTFAPPDHQEQLHDAHNAYPLAPERMVVQKKWLSEYQHNLLGIGVAPTEVEKLVPNLRNKDRYVLHYRNLQLYTSLGMRLTKVHRGLTKALRWSRASG